MRQETTFMRLRNVFSFRQFWLQFEKKKRTELHMNGLIYLIGLIVVIMAVLSLLGLR